MLINESKWIGKKLLELIENKKVFVDIGSKNICEKSIEEAKEFLTRQIKKIRDVREELVEEIEKMSWFH